MAHGKHVASGWTWKRFALAGSHCKQEGVHRRRQCTNMTASVATAERGIIDHNIATGHITIDHIIAAQGQSQDQGHSHVELSDIVNIDEHSKWDVSEKLAKVHSPSTTPHLTSQSKLSYHGSTSRPMLCPHPPLARSHIPCLLFCHSGALSMCLSACLLTSIVTSLSPSVLSPSRCGVC